VSILTHAEHNGIEWSRAQFQINLGGVISGSLIDITLGIHPVKDDMGFTHPETCDQS